MGTTSIMSMGTMENTDAIRITVSMGTTTTTAARGIGNTMIRRHSRRRKRIRISNTTE